MFNSKVCGKADCKDHPEKLCCSLSYLNRHLHNKPIFSISSSQFSYNCMSLVGWQNLDSGRRRELRNFRPPALVLSLSLSPVTSWSLILRDDNQSLKINLGLLSGRASPGCDSNPPPAALGAGASRSQSPLARTCGGERMFLPQLNTSRTFTHLPNMLANL